MSVSKRGKRKEGRDTEWKFLFFPLGGAGHPPTTNYHFFRRPKETVFTKKLHGLEWVWV